MNLAQIAKRIAAIGESEFSTLQKCVDLLEPVVVNPAAKPGDWPISSLKVKSAISQNPDLALAGFFAIWHSSKVNKFSGFMRTQEEFANSLAETILSGRPLLLKPEDWPREIETQSGTKIGNLVSVEQARQTAAWIGSRYSRQICDIVTSTLAKNSPEFLARLHAVTPEWEPRFK